MMPWTRDGAFAWDTFLPNVPFRGSAVVREAARLVTAALFLGLMGYCLFTVWDVLRELRAVKLVDCRRALDVVSVHDAVLCLVGYRVGLELLRAVTRRQAS